MDWLVDTNIILRAADNSHGSSLLARKAMKILFRQGHRLCVARQSLLEAWVVATRPREVNGFGYSPTSAADGLSKVKRLFHVLAEMDDIYEEWEKLVVRHDVSGKAAYDTRLVASMNIHQVQNILTFNTSDFTRYQGIQVAHPEQVVNSRA